MYPAVKKNISNLFKIKYNFNIYLKKYLISRYQENSKTKYSPVRL
jgi:hypothetical protein